MRVSALASRVSLSRPSYSPLPRGSCLPVFAVCVTCMNSCVRASIRRTQQRADDAETDGRRRGRQEHKLGGGDERGLRNNNSEWRERSELRATRSALLSRTWRDAHWCRAAETHNLDEGDQQKKEMKRRVARRREERCEDSGSAERRARVLRSLGEGRK